MSVMSAIIHVSNACGQVKVSVLLLQKLCYDITWRRAVYKARPNDNAASREGEIMDNPDVDIYEYLGSAAEFVNKLEQAREKRQKLSDEVTALEKHRNSVKKAMTDEINISVKKRRDELAAGFKGRIQEANRELKGLQEKKEAARNAGRKERIMRETAGLRKVTASLEKEQKAALADAQVSGIYAKNWFFHIFLPQKPLDYVWVLLSMALIVFVIPFLIMHFMYDLSDVVQMIVFLIAGLLFMGEYMIVHMTVCIPKKDILEEINARAMSIKENRKEIKNIQSAIMTDENEEYYHLDDFNYDIAKAEAYRDEVTRKRDEALENFDNVTAGIISDEIKMGYDEELEKTEENLSERKEVLAKAEKYVKSLNAKALQEYAPRLGEENLTSDRIEGIMKVAEDKHPSSLAEAVNMYNGHVF